MRTRNGSKCEYCRSDSDCAKHAGDHSKRCHPFQSENPFTQTLETTIGRNSRGESVAAAFCIEKDLFAPFTRTDVLGTLVAFAATALGSGCGVGGGGLLVPGFIFFMGLSPKHAIPLSKATIFGNAVAIFVFNYYRKHPSTFVCGSVNGSVDSDEGVETDTLALASVAKPRVPIINYAVAAIMEPTTLIGAIFGVMLNRIFPNWLILVLLISLLSFITYKTFLKGRQVRTRCSCTRRTRSTDRRSYQQIHDKESKKNRELIKSALKGRPSGGGRGRRWSIYRVRLPRLCQYARDAAQLCRSY